MNLNKDKPGTRMTEEEWKATASIRRELVVQIGHLRWSEMTVAQCDEAVRHEAKSRGSMA